MRCNLCSAQIFTLAVLLCAVGQSRVRAEGEDKPRVAEDAENIIEQALAGDNAKLLVHFHISGQINEQSAPEDAIPFLDSGSSEAGIRDWLRRIEKAAASTRVSGILLTVDSPRISWEHVQELRAALQKARKNGKPVVAHADDLTTLHYLLAASADKVYLSPAGSLMLNGLSARQWFMKGTLEKLGIQADMHHVGSHKGAAEPLTLTSPSKELQDMMNWMLDDWYSQLAQQVGQCRGSDAAAGKKWIDGGPYTALQAQAAGLIDGVKDRADASAELRRLTGAKETDKFDAKYGKKKRPTLDFSSAFGLLNVFTSMTSRKAPSTKPAIAILYAEGTINSGDGGEDTTGGSRVGSSAVIPFIEKARKDPSIKAVVLRIDSPGGSALASESIHAALKRLKAEKPLIVSMGSVAASGGYYIAACADRIFAQPTSIVGSIGVVGGKMVFKGVYDWMGMTSFKYTRGGDKVAIFDEVTGFSPEEKKWFVDSMTEVYTLFVKAVNDGRGGKLRDFEEKIAGGKIFTGRQALNNGLIDELGGIARAIEFSAERAGFKEKEYEVRVLNSQPKFMDRFLGMMGGDDGDDDAALSSANFLRKLPGSSGLRQSIMALATINPQHAKVLFRQLEMVQMIQQRKMLLMMPFEITVQP
jgi:protease IV